MRTDLPHSFGVHWTIGRKPWLNRRNPGRTASQALWSMAWETLRLHQPETCGGARASRARKGQARIDRDAQAGDLLTVESEGVASRRGCLGRCRRPDP